MSSACRTRWTDIRRPFFAPFFANAPLPAWLSPAILTLWIPIGFRITCYYFRRAYYRSYLADPPACAVGEPPIHRRYRMEAALPFILQNLHRFFLYLAVVLLVIHWVEVGSTFFPEGRFRIGLGSLILVDGRRAPDRLRLVLPLAAAHRRRTARLLLLLARQSDAPRGMAAPVRAERAPHDLGLGQPGLDRRGRPVHPHACARCPDRPGRSASSRRPR